MRGLLRPAEVYSGITTVSSGGAPDNATYVVLSADATLSNEQVLGTDVLMRGVLASRPAAGVNGRRYVATDVFREYADDGAAWQLIVDDHSQLANLTAVGAHPATSIANTPAGNIAATTVQAALNELDVEKALLSHTHGTADITNDAVTFAKMQNITTDRLIGRDTAASGDPEEIALNATLEFDGSLNLRRAALTGDVTSPAGSNATTLASVGPGATGPIGSATTTPVLTTDVKGRVTGFTSATITGVTPGGAAGGVLSGTYPNPGFAVDMATQAELDAHTGAGAGAHAGTAISNAPAGNVSGTTVQAAINELDTEKVAIASLAPISIINSSSRVFERMTFR